uniref:Uncharacterized protein n=1 Tax=Caenorhabditis japonica TaxID=281687 RepID=A0A8R1E5T3_CAEJA
SSQHMQQQQQQQSHQNHNGAAQLMINRLINGG